MRYEATMVFRDPAIKLLEAIATKLKIIHISWILCLNFNRDTPLVHCDVIGSGSKTEHVTGIVMSTPCPCRFDNSPPMAVRHNKKSERPVI